MTAAHARTSAKVARTSQSLLHGSPTFFVTFPNRPSTMTRSPTFTCVPRIRVRICWQKRASRRKQSPSVRHSTFKCFAKCHGICGLHSAMLAPRKVWRITIAWWVNAGGPEEAALPRHEKSSSPDMASKCAAFGSEKIKQGGREARDSPANRKRSALAGPTSWE